MDYVDKDIINNYPGHYVRVKPNIPIEKSKADIDCTDPELNKIYKESAYNEAIKSLCEEEKYGPYGDRSLAEWISENTSRKKEIIM